MVGTLNPGDNIEYVVTFLEMTARPSWPTPAMPMGHKVSLLAATAPPVDYFLYLYGQVGGAHEWTDWFDRPRADQQAFVENPAISLYTMTVDGWPGGFFVLDTREPDVCDLAYFGLVPQAIGRGLGKWLLATAIHAGWDRAGVGRMTVNTNTLDHPRAIGLYQKMGFQPVRRETHTRILTRERSIQE